ncbi:hypothetical protein GJ744_005370 [Endocarpon pusillum]|uniref:Endonuclease/exonuclease/phosphatase domain-containing protein n=1 Tax=Endocarpon pusillum TaxID=364733 RepID=A0A8H7AN12_9EURO|nr:hypothetical protein GJ744_005370 [Endocarpon pusillum]
MATITTTQPKTHNRSTSAYQNENGHETRKGEGNENDISISMQPLPQKRETQQQQHEGQNRPFIPSEDLQPRIRILTHNIWALKHLSPYRPERLAHIAHLIATSPNPPDIICLQECWTYPNYALLRRRLSALYRHGKFYHSGCFGGGLVILSKWRIIETEMVPYTLNGRPSAFWRGDWFVGKGVAVARIALPSKFGRKNDNTAKGRYLEVFNTHLHAPYNEGKEGKDTYAVHRVAQAWQIARMMRHALERGNLVVACGDFNMSPGGIESAVIQHQTRGLMRDVWQERFPDSSWGAWIEERERERLRERGGKEAVGKSRTGPPTVEATLLKHGHTCDSVFNTWRWEKRAQRDLLKKGIDRVVGLHEEDPRAKRLDYVFFGDGSNTRDRVGSRDGTGEWTVKEASISMTERHPHLKCSLSDHFAVEAEIAWTTTPGRIRDEQNGDTIPPIDNPISSYPLDIPKILTLLITYTARQRTHRRRRCIHFLASVVITLSCFVAVWFSPANYLSFILLVLSSLGLMAGTVDGLIGLLFGGWELRALKEWEGEGGGE